ncbi:MAG: LapA family protein [Bacteroidota bacterium]|nr:LapA family protein [Bacteroidota bacterium]MDP4225016.1 LapA family protein [Bacteroidota bacterium]MDP4274080.1 LapA family protein [Bacteroidota bacterium]
MQKSLLVGLIIAVIMVIFAIQNAGEIVVNLWFWQVKSSLVFILLFTFILGAIFGLVFSIPTLNQKKKQIKELLEKKEGQNDNEIKQN